MSLRFPSPSRPSSLGVAVVLLPLALASFAGCDEDSPPRSDAPDPTWVTADEGLTLTATAPPIDGLPAGVEFFDSIAYGTDPDQEFDAFLPESAEPTAAIVYVHGGGFVSGSRTELYDGSGGGIFQAVSAGVAFIGVDYRLLLTTPGAEDVGVAKSLHDSRRALQFIRFHAAELNIDPDRIGMYGGSAGAGTSLWLGFHDEMAQRRNPDLIARESTRLSAIGAVSTQATYDVLRWAPDVFEAEYPLVSNDLLLSVGSALDLLIRFYGLPPELKTDTNELLRVLYGEEWTEARADLDMLALASDDDPPVFVFTTGPNVGPMDDGFDLLHHPLHAKTISQAAIDAGNPVVEARIDAYGITSTYSNPVTFLLDHL